MPCGASNVATGSSAGATEFASHGEENVILPLCFNAACTAAAFLTVGLWSLVAAAAASFAAALEALRLILA